LWENLGHTVVTGTLFRGKLLILDVLRGRTPISVGLKVGALVDLHASAQGRVLLAFGPANLFDRVVETPFEPHTPKTITDVAKLRSELKRIRLNGWASAPDQLVLGMNAIGCPIFQHDATLAGT